MLPSLHPSEELRIIKACFTNGQTLMHPYSTLERYCIHVKLSSGIHSEKPLTVTVDCDWRGSPSGPPTNHRCFEISRVRVPSPFAPILGVDCR